MKHLISLLEKNLSYSPRYQNGLTNHLSMGLIALHFLGASDIQLDGFYNGYITILEPTTQSTIYMTQKNWIDHLGQGNAFFSYYTFFQKAYQNSGLEAILAKFLPQLMEGAGADAFHCLIRLSYALELYEANGANAQNSVIIDEILFSLAYFADAHLPLPMIEEEKSIDILLTELIDIKPKSNYENLLLIFLKMKEASETKAYRRIASHIKYDKNIYQKFLELTLQLYAQHQNFTLLHAFTSTHALDVLLKYVENKASACNHYWRALVAAYLTVPYKESDAVKSVDLSWDEIIHRAKGDLDPHVIKVVYSAYRQQQLFIDLDFKMIASRAVK